MTSKVGRIFLVILLGLSTGACVKRTPTTPQTSTYYPSTWSTKTVLTANQAAGTAGVFSSSMYIASGLSAGAVTGAVRAYDSAADSWSTKTSISTPRCYTAGGTIGNSLYVAGGCANCDCLAGLTGMLQVYDSSANTWATKTSMPVTLNQSSAGIINGKLYVIGGETACAPCTARTDVYEYDPGLNTWATKSNMPTARKLSAAAVVDNILYVIGGATSTDLSVVEAYDPSNDTWSTKASMPTARSSLSAGVVNGRIYAIGGNAGATILGNVEVYDPSTNTWSTETVMPTPRLRAFLGVIGTSIYVAGGQDIHGNALNTLEAFQ